MVRVIDPEATIRFFELIGLKEVRRMENDRAVCNCAGRST
jgi:lactoylglutathione lyase